MSNVEDIPVVTPAPGVWFFALSFLFYTFIKKIEIFDRKFEKNEKCMKNQHEDGFDILVFIFEC